MLIDLLIELASFMSKLLSNLKWMELAKISHSAVAQLCELDPVS